MWSHCHTHSSAASAPATFFSVILRALYWYEWVNFGFVLSQVFDLHLGFILVLHAVLCGRVSWWMSRVINIYTSPLNYECAINVKRFFEPRPRPLNLNHIKAQGKAWSLLFVMATVRLHSQYSENITPTVAIWIPLHLEPFMDVLNQHSVSISDSGKNIGLDIGKISYNHNNTTGLMKSLQILKAMK